MPELGIKNLMANNQAITRKGAECRLKTAGFTVLWVPPPSKGKWSIDGVGYGSLDHDHLTAYNQKGTTDEKRASNFRKSSGNDGNYNGE